jgi:hypothetical protein
MKHLKVSEIDLTKLETTLKKASKQSKEILNEINKLADGDLSMKLLKPVVEDLFQGYQQEIEKLQNKDGNKKKMFQIYEDKIMIPTFQKILVMPKTPPPSEIAQSTSSSKNSKIKFTNLGNPRLGKKWEMENKMQFIVEKAKAQGKNPKFYIEILKQFQNEFQIAIKKSSKILRETYDSEKGRAAFQEHLNFAFEKVVATIKYEESKYFKNQNNNYKINKKSEKIKKKNEKNKRNDKYLKQKSNNSLENAMQSFKTQTDELRLIKKREQKTYQKYEQLLKKYKKLQNQKDDLVTEIRKHSYPTTRDFDMRPIDHKIVFQTPRNTLTTTFEKQKKNKRAKSKNKGTNSVRGTSYKKYQPEKKARKTKNNQFSTKVENWNSDGQQDELYDSLRKKFEKSKSQNTKIRKTVGELRELVDSLLNLY